MRYALFGFPDATLLHKPVIAMLLSLLLVIIVAIPKQEISKLTGWFLVICYPLFLVVMLK